MCVCVYEYVEKSVKENPGSSAYPVCACLCVSVCVYEHAC